MEFSRYLQAKRTVDDRAIDRRVLSTLRDELADTTRPRVLEVACGIGAGLERLLDWGVLGEPRYVGIDRAAELVAVARERLGERAFVELHAESLDDYAARAETAGGFDLVMAHAFLDIVPLAETLRQLLSLARPGGLLYLPITFDGASIFEPADPDDAEVLAAYHRTMDRRGSSRTGRRLFHALRDQGASVLALGSSDWIVHAADEGYRDDEAYFLECVLEFVETSVGGAASAWLTRRRAQLARGELVYIAHQLDALARR